MEAKEAPNVADAREARRL